MNAQSPLFQIETRRIAAGISREQLAAAAGLSESIIERQSPAPALRAPPRSASFGRHWSGCRVCRAPKTT